MKQKSLVSHLKDWWWLYGVVTALCSIIVLWGGIPTRLAKAEQKNEKQDEDLGDLKGWAREIQGYTQAQQQYNQMQRQVPNQSAPVRLTILRELDQDGTCWECPSLDRQQCFDDHLWVRCHE